MTRTDRILDLMVAADSTGRGVREAIAATLGGNSPNSPEWIKERRHMGIHWTELIVVAFVALLIFGPKRLPEIGGAVGRTYREFKKSLGEISELATKELAPERQLPPAAETDAPAHAIRDASPPRT
jgi:sec-independent protein translocase protein TatA